MINLKDYGIDVGLLISGLFGAILLTSKESAMNLTRTISSLIGGAASANYVTPIIINITNLDSSHYHYGIAFLLGFLGLKGVETLSHKLLPDAVHHEEAKEETKEEFNPLKTIKKKRTPKT
ncbi:MAG: hypothetical protein RLZZ196_2074 [Bacteroidota bacterium]|jgi:hypothetical protein